MEKNNRFIHLFIVLGCMVTMASCKLEEKTNEKTSVQQSVVLPTSKVEVLEMEVPQVVQLNELSKMILKIETEPNDKIFYKITGNGDQNPFIPNAGIIYSQGDIGQLTAKLQAVSKGTNTYTLTLTDHNNQSVLKTFSVHVE